MESLSTYGASGLNRLRELSARIQRETHPYLKAFALVCCYGVILIANSLVRNRDLYGELSAGYVFFLYVGGTAALVAESFVRALGFYALFGRRVEAGFGRLFLGIVIFGCLTVIAALINLAVPIVVTTRVGGSYSSYSILSLQYFLGLEGQPVLLRAIVALLDVLVIAQLAAPSFYVSWVARVAFWKVFLAAALIEVVIGIGAWWWG